MHCDIGSQHMKINFTTKTRLISSRRTIHFHYLLLLSQNSFQIPKHETIVGDFNAMANCHVMKMQSNTPDTTADPDTNVCPNDSQNALNSADTLSSLSFFVRARKRGIWECMFGPGLLTRSHRAPLGPGANYHWPPGRPWWRKYAK